jgi:hypothetical protein
VFGELCICGLLGCSATLPRLTIQLSLDRNRIATRARATVFRDSLLVSYFILRYLSDLAIVHELFIYFIFLLPVCSPCFALSGLRDRCLAFADVWVARSIVARRGVLPLIVGGICCGLADGLVGSYRGGVERYPDVDEPAERFETW